ncbi:hypothetical protein IWX90DRAFT_128512 [Phyllosticta citrichinensis]|uniref:Uncharacterized protein n=1 Tax=Phyllosticta citrichinensis TaxID=1130410 RepID=A0ABR1Y479_9PEZI
MVASTWSPALPDSAQRTQTACSPICARRATILAVACRLSCAIVGDSQALSRLGIAPDPPDLVPSRPPLSRHLHCTRIATANSVSSTSTEVSSHRLWHRVPLCSLLHLYSALHPILPWSGPFACLQGSRSFFNVSNAPAPLFRFDGIYPNSDDNNSGPPQVHLFSQNIDNMHMFRHITVEASTLAYVSRRSCASVQVVL